MRTVSGWLAYDEKETGTKKVHFFSPRYSLMN